MYGTACTRWAESTKRRDHQNPSQQSSAVSRRQSRQGCSQSAEGCGSQEVYSVKEIRSAEVKRLRQSQPIEKARKIERDIQRSPARAARAKLATQATAAACGDERKNLPGRTNRQHPARRCMPPTLRITKATSGHTCHGVPIPGPRNCALGLMPSAPAAYARNTH